MLKFLHAKLILPHWPNSTGTSHFKLKSQKCTCTNKILDVLLPLLVPDKHFLISEPDPPTGVMHNNISQKGLISHRESSWTIIFAGKLVSQHPSLISNTCELHWVITQQRTLQSPDPYLGTSTKNSVSRTWRNYRFYFFTFCMAFRISQVLNGNWIHQCVTIWDVWEIVMML